MTQRLAALPGLHLTGNSLYGISVNHCAKEAYAVVDAVVAAAVRPVGAR